MHKQYTFEIDPANVYVVGDIHGNFKLLKFKIRELDIRDSIIIIAGDCGFGFEKEVYYVETYNKIKKVLIENNVTLLFVRGNHDDKQYFDGNKINFKNFIAIPDYSVITLKSDYENFNILCVGGAISIDRQYRKDKEAIIGKKLYWEDEYPIYEPEILDKIKSDGIEINTLITHTTTSFAPPQDKNGISSFIAYDEKLIEDTDNERKVIDNIYNHLVLKDKHPLELMVHGHFHSHTFYTSNEGVKIIGLDMCHEWRNSWEIYPVRYKTMLMDLE